MIIGKVIGRVISTRKHELLVGQKFLVCEVKDKQVSGISHIVAVDSVGAGIGEMVLITRGSSARLGTNQSQSPIDAAIVGILDDENNFDL